MCLFGGAIFAAGIAGSNADAQPFVHTYDIGIIEADRLDGGSYNIFPMSTDPGGFGTYAYADADLFAQFTANADEVSFTHNRASSDTFLNSYAGLAAQFSVPTATLVTLKWDFGSWATSYCALTDISLGVVLFDTGAVAAGEVGFTLDPGTEYDIIMFTRGDAAGGDSFGRFAVAEPCGVADINGDGLLNTDDIDDFIAAFLAQDPSADLDGNGLFNVDDIDAFVDGFLGGCP